MAIFYYDLDNGEIYRSNRQVDYRMLCKCLRCLKVEYGNVQVLKDRRNEWHEYPINNKELSWIVLKSKDIPRPWRT